MVVVEAMSFGLPVVASAVGALPELVKQDKTGILVKPGSVPSLEAALSAFVIHPELVERYGKAGRKRFLERFHISQMQGALLSVYRKEIAESAASGKMG